MYPPQKPCCSLLGPIPVVGTPAGGRTVRGPCCHQSLKDPFPGSSGLIQSHYLENEKKDVIINDKILDVQAMQ